MHRERNIVIGKWYRFQDGRQAKVLRKVDMPNSDSVWYKCMIERDAGSGFPEQLQEWESGQRVLDVRKTTSALNFYTGSVTSDSLQEL